MGYYRDRGRRDRRRDCPGRSVTRLQGGAAGTKRFWKRYVESLDQAGAWGRALSATGKYYARHGSPKGARHPSPKRAASGAQLTVRSPKLSLVGSTVLRHRTQSL